MAPRIHKLHTCGFRHDSMVGREEQEAQGHRGSMTAMPTPVSVITAIRLSMLQGLLEEGPFPP